MTTPNWSAGSQQASYLTLMQTSSNSRKQISFQNEHAVLVYPPAHRNKCQHQDRAVDQGGSTPLQVCWGSCHSVTTPASALPSSSWTDPSCPPFCWRTEKTSSCLYAPLFPSFFWDSCCSCICHRITKDFDDQLNQQWQSRVQSVTVKSHSLFDLRAMSANCHSQGWRFQWSSQCVTKNHTSGLAIVSLRACVYSAVSAITDHYFIPPSGKAVLCCAPMSRTDTDCHVKGTQQHYWHSGNNKHKSTDLESALVT